MSCINLTRKATCISSFKFNTPTTSIKESYYNPPIVSIIFAEDIANELNIQTQYLKLSETVSDQSKICVLDSAKFRSAYDGELTEELILSDNCGFFRLVTMEESSTSIMEMDDLSDTSISLKYEHDNDDTHTCLSELYLGPFIVKTTSLMAVSSAAHENKLISEFNKIFVKLPVNPNRWVNKCRICYGTISDEKLIQPCKCKGSVACAHLSCLEHWLRESGRSYCELCKHNFQVLRTPKYGLLKSIMVWLSSSGEHTPLLIEDLISFSLYTPAAVCSTYILMLLSENALRNTTDENVHAANLITFFAFAGIAAIDFTYSSWLMICLQRHLFAWRMWYRENCCLTLILPDSKHNRLQSQASVEVD